MARVLPLQHMVAALAAKAGTSFNPPALAPNQMQLYSYYAPGLDAGNYTIEVEQNISSQSYEQKPNSNDKAWTNASLHIRNTKKDPAGDVALQEFEVMAPQFSLPERSMINSYYPPDGHQDEARILPHIVFNDPHFPWERRAGQVVPNFCDQDKSDRTTDTEEVNLRNKTPWIAVLVFDPDELRLDQTYNTPLIDNKKPIDLKLDKQAPTSAFTMAVSDYFNIDQASRVKYEASLPVGSTGLKELQGSSETMTAIFPTKANFVKMFSHLDSKQQFTADVAAHKYLAHVRAVNTQGFPDAGTEMVGNYSIVIAGRTPRLDLKVPSTQIAHLVSIEDIDSTIEDVYKAVKADKAVGAERIAMVSLFSWTYTALPPNPFNFVDDMRNVVQGMQMLKPPQATLNTLSAATNDAAKSSDAQAAAKTLYGRLDSGYSLARWRAETGEESAAFSRGPLVSQRVRWPVVDDWCAGSNTSKEFQILDPDTGLMDLSYSSAWQLGKALAIADTGFRGALMRFRSSVYNWAVNKVHSQQNGLLATNKLVANLGTHVKTIGGLAQGDTKSPRRLVPPVDKVLAPPAIDHPATKPLIARAIRAAVTKQSSAGEQIWTDFSLDGPTNTDWPVISNWISEKLSLADIPAHFLVPDPSFLPHESLRLFHIDRNWLDCLVDGALSVANHLDREDDLVRTYIKEMYNKYLNTEVGGSHKTQVPFYGFILRSQIVEVMPDMRITVSWNSATPAAADPRAPYCRYTKLDSHTLMCLLDRQPEELQSITFAQPPHQQRFSLGYQLTADGIPEFNLTQLYTQNPPHGIWDTSKQTMPQTPGLFYDPDSRMVRVAQLAQAINEKLTLQPRTDPKDYTITNQAYLDFVPNSAELAMELNDKAYFFTLLPPKLISELGEADTRQLWTVDTESWTEDPVVPPDTTVTAGIGGDEPKPSNTGGGSGTNQPLPVPISSPAAAAASNNYTIIKGPSPMPIKGTTKLSCFKMTIFADYKGIPTTWPDKMLDANAYIPMNNTYLFDLVFSIRRSRNGSQQMLQEILISIPHTGAKDTEEPLIEKDYGDPRARMLSNQRFVILLNNTDTHLQVRLIPRSSKTSPSIRIDDDRTSDISFRLAEVPITVTHSRPQPGFYAVHGQANKAQGWATKVQWWEVYTDGFAPGAGTGAVVLQKVDRKDG